MTRGETHGNANTTPYLDRHRGTAEATASIDNKWDLGFWPRGMRRGHDTHGTEQVGGSRYRGRNPQPVRGDTPGHVKRSEGTGDSAIPRGLDIADTTPAAPPSHTEVGSGPHAHHNKRRTSGCRRSARLAALGADECTSGTSTRYRASNA